MLAEGWYFDGVPAEDYGRTIRDRSGWDDTPSTRGEDATLLGKHGTVWRPKKYGPGRKTLTFEVHGVLPDGSLPAAGSARRARYEEHLDGLLRLVADRNRLMEVERVYADGSRRRALMECVSDIRPEDVGDDFGRVQVELSIPGSFMEDTDPETYTLPYDVVAGGAQDIEVYSLRGQTAPCADPVVTVVGSCASVSVRDTRTGSGFLYATALGGGEALVVDAGAFTATRSGVSVLTDLTLFDGQLLEVSKARVAHRGPSVTVTAEDPGESFSVTLETRRKWLR